MAGSPIVSVVIVNFNSADYLAEAVSSVLNSTIAVEIVVVDNRSSDDSLDILRRRFDGDIRLRVVQNRRNLGFARASNRGIRLSRGRHVLLLNPDCVVAPDVLNLMVAHLERDPAVGMASCVIRNPDGTEQAGSRRVVPTPWRSLVRILALDRFFPNHPRFNNFCRVREPLPKEPTYVEAISGAFMLVRRKALEQVGPLDKKYFLHCEDLDWCMRFRMEGWKILFAPDVNVLHYKGVCSVAHPFRVLWHKHVGMMRFYRKFFRHQYPMPLSVIVAMGVWSRFALLAGRESLRAMMGKPVSRPRREARDSVIAYLSTKQSHEDRAFALAPSLPQSPVQIPHGNHRETSRHV